MGARLENACLKEPVYLEYAPSCVVKTHVQAGMAIPTNSVFGEYWIMLCTTGKQETFRSELHAVCR